MSAVVDNSNRARDYLACWEGPDGSLQYTSADTMCQHPRWPSTFRSQRDGAESYLPCDDRDSNCPGCRTRLRRELQRRCLETLRGLEPTRWNVAAGENHEAPVVVRWLWFVSVECSLDDQTRVNRQLKKRRHLKLLPWFSRRGASGIGLLTWDGEAVVAEIRKLGLPARARRLGKLDRLRTYRWLADGMNTPRSDYGDDRNRYYMVGLKRLETPTKSVVKTTSHATHIRGHEQVAWSAERGILRTPKFWKKGRGEKPGAPSSPAPGPTRLTVAQLPAELREKVYRIGSRKPQFPSETHEQRIEREKVAEQFLLDLKARNAVKEAKAAEVEMDDKKVVPIRKPEPVEKATDKLVRILERIEQRLTDIAESKISSPYPSKGKGYLTSDAQSEFQARVEHAIEARGNDPPYLEAWMYRQLIDDKAPRREPKPESAAGEKIDTDAILAKWYQRYADKERERGREVESFADWRARNRKLPPVLQSWKPRDS